MAHGQLAPPQRCTVFLDPVHAEIVVSNEIAPILNTKPFVRLRRLQQLGVCSSVFPGATHTRFAHSLGVGHLARRWAEHLSASLQSGLLGDLDTELCAASKTDLLRVELAGYAHDLGHGPLSHLWERFLSVRALELEAQACEFDRAKKPALAAAARAEATTLTNWKHEVMSEALLDMAVAEAISSADLPASHFLQCPANVTAVKDMIAGNTAHVTPQKAWLYTIVNNRQSGLDVDKMDYLCRDQLYVGLKEPAPFRDAADIQALLLGAQVVATSGDAYGVPGDGASEVCGRRERTEIVFKARPEHGEKCCVKLIDQLFRTRKAMHESVYQSQRVLGAEEMVMRFLRSILTNVSKRKAFLEPQWLLNFDDSILNCHNIALLDGDSNNGNGTVGQQQQHDGVDWGAVWQALEEPLVVPQAVVAQVLRKPVRLEGGKAIQGHTIKDELKLKHEIERQVMAPLRHELCADVQGVPSELDKKLRKCAWVTVSDCHEGCKDVKAIARVRFLNRAGAAWSVGALDSTRLKQHLPQDPARHFLVSVHFLSVPGFRSSEHHQRISAAFGGQLWCRWIACADQMDQNTHNACANDVMCKRDTVHNAAPVFGQLTQSSQVSTQGAVWPEGQVLNRNSIAVELSPAKKCIDMQPDARGVGQKGKRQGSVRMVGRRQRARNMAATPDGAGKL